MARVWAWDQFEIKRMLWNSLCTRSALKKFLFDTYLCVIFLQAIQQLQPKTPHAQSTNNAVPFVFLVGTALDIFQSLIVDLDTEGRYLFLNAVANQLRYPNTHTHYFSFILLYLFAESNQVWNDLLLMLLGTLFCVFLF